MAVSARGSAAPDTCTRRIGTTVHTRRDPAAHLTETSSLVTPENAERMLRSWAAHWDLSRPLLLEKSPPNLVMTRMLQAMYPDAKFVVIVRHPVVVSLSTHKWVRGRRLKFEFRSTLSRPSCSMPTWPCRRPNAAAMC